MGYQCSPVPPAKGAWVAVLLPRAVKAEEEILEEGVAMVEHREAHDVDPMVSHVVQLQHRKLLWRESVKSLEAILWTAFPIMNANMFLWTFGDGKWKLMKPKMLPYDFVSPFVRISVLSEGTSTVCSGEHRQACAFFLKYANHNTKIIVHCSAWLPSCQKFVPGPCMGMIW